MVRAVADLVIAEQEQDVGGVVVVGAPAVQHDVVVLIALGDRVGVDQVQELRPRGDDHDMAGDAEFVTDAALYIVESRSVLPDV